MGSESLLPMPKRRSHAQRSMVPHGQSRFCRITSLGLPARSIPPGLISRGFGASSHPKMPELPEVESLRRILARSAVGLTIAGARIGTLPLRRKRTPDFGAEIIGRRIERVTRRAKYLMIELSGDSIIL